MKTLKRIVSLSLLPKWSVLLIDIMTVILSCLLACVIYSRSLAFAISNQGGSVSDFILLAVGLNLLLFVVFRTFTNILRLSSFVDLMRIFVAVTISYGLVSVVSFVFGNLRADWNIDFTMIFIAYTINLLLMLSSRFVVKVIFDMINNSRTAATNVMIYGAKEAGASIAKSLRVSQEFGGYKLKGFIADEPELIGKSISGMDIYANDATLIDVLRQKRVSSIIVSPAKADEIRHSNFADQMLELGITLLVAPPIGSWEDNILKQTQMRKIEIEDLLQRNPIEIDMSKISSHLESKTIMITGTAGSIGSEIVRQVAGFNPYRLVLIDQAETPLHDVRLELHDKWRNIEAETIVADIANATRMRSIFQQYKPNYIFHAAAYKHVPMMENNVSESIQTNVAGTRILADLAVEFGVDKFVMISTDKAVNPTNVMGCSKRICEIYVQSLAKSKRNSNNGMGGGTQFITTRFGNVLGSNGSVIPRFKEQIEQGGPVTVTHPEIIRYFMTIPEACRLVLEAGSMGKGGEIYIFDMGKPVKILDLAKRMIKLSGKTNIKIEFTGLRHGEKLYEELLNVKEQTKPTYNEKIMIANVREYDYEEVSKRIQNLIDVSYTYDPMAIVGAMKDIVPEFISKNSEFEVLDKK